MTVTFQLSKYCRLEGYNDKRGNDEEGLQHILIFVDLNKLRADSLRLNELQHAILNLFRGAITPEKVLENILSEFDVEEQVTPDLRLFMISFIRTSLRNLILVERK